MAEEEQQETGDRRFLNIKSQVDRRRKEPVQKTILEWQEPGKQGWAKHGLEESEPAAESFHEALANFAPWVKERLASALNVDPGNTSATIRVLGAAYNYSDDGSFKITLSATLDVPGQGSPLVQNFTHIVPDRKLQTLLTDLEAEAGAYIDGERGQLQMELDPSQEGADVDPPQDDEEVPEV